MRHDQDKFSFTETLHDDGCEQVAENGLGLCESVVRSGRWHLAYRRIEVEEADGSSSRQERVCVVISLAMEINSLEVEEDLSTMAMLFLCGRCVDGKQEESEEQKHG